MPLKPWMTKARVTKCGDGHWRRVVYGIGPYIADYPEQCMLACVVSVSGWCPRYTSRLVLFYFSSYLTPTPDASQLPAIWTGWRHRQHPHPSFTWSHRSRQEALWEQVKGNVGRLWNYRGHRGCYSTPSNYEVFPLSSHTPPAIHHPLSPCQYTRAAIARYPTPTCQGNIQRPPGHMDRRIPGILARWETEGCRDGLSVRRLPPFPM